MGDRRLLWLLGGFGMLLGVVAELVQLGSGVRGDRLLVDFLVGQAYLVGGLFAWSREPRNRTWKLMTGVGFAWYVGALAASEIPIVHALGVVLADTDAILLAALVLAYPTGHLERRSERLAVLAAAVGLTVGDLLLLVTGDGTVALIIGLLVTAAMAVLVVRRWSLATPHRRRLLAPALIATALTLTAIALAIIVRLARVPPPVADVVLAARDLVLLGIPLGFVVGFFQQSADRYRALLAAIPDPIARYDHSGRSLPLETGQVGAGPEASSPVLEDLPEDVAVRMVAAAREALTSRRMQTLEYETVDPDGGPRSVEARVVPSGDDDVIAIARDFTAQRAAEAELRASRARIVAAGDEARRRLERDLHDGAQQRLVALVVALRVLQARADDHADAELVHGLDEATRELQAGLAELRDLAQGIHPAVLTEAGLAAGLATLAERSPIPARVAGVPDRRLPPEVEATAYFVASEALANAAKHAAANRVTIAAQVDDGQVEISIADDGLGGASVSGGTGLRGLVDRVESLGGELRVVSLQGQGTTVIARIPIEVSGIPHGAG